MFLVKEEDRLLLPYIAIAINLSKRKFDYQQTVNFANDIARLVKNENKTTIDLNNSEIANLYAALKNTLQTYTANHDECESSYPFVYCDISLDERLSNDQFLASRDAAANFILTQDLSMYQKTAVLTAFQILSQSNSSRGMIINASQLEKLRQNAWFHLNDLWSFTTNGIHIKDIAKQRIQQHKAQLLTQYLTQINIINNAAVEAYKALDEKYAQLLATSVNKLKQEFEKQRKKALRKACKNFEISIAAMAVTACVAPYACTFISAALEVGTLAGIEALLATAAIESITYTALSIGTESVLRGNFNGFSKNFVDRVAISFGAKVTSGLMSANGSGNAARGSIEAVKISAANAAMRSGLQSILTKGKMNDIVKSTLLGGISGAATEKLVSTFQKFDIGITLDEVTKHALEDGLQEGVHSIMFGLGNKEDSSHQWLINGLVAGLSSYVTGHVAHGIRKIDGVIRNETTSVQLEAKNSPQNEPQPNKEKNSEVINVRRHENVKDRNYVYRHVREHGEAKHVSRTRIERKNKYSTNKENTNKTNPNQNSKNIMTKPTNFKQWVNHHKDRKQQIRLGLLFNKFQSSFPEIETLYRGDARSYTERFKDGFTARGSNTDLIKHAIPPDSKLYLNDSAYISTSTSKDISRTFPKNLYPGTTVSYLYEISSKRPTFDVIEILRPLFERGLISEERFLYHLVEDEKAFLNKIYPHEIKGAYVINIQISHLSDPVKNLINSSHITHIPYEYSRIESHKFIPNPNYIPPYYLEEALWNKGRNLGRALTIVGVAADGFSLYKQIKISQTTEDYTNTYREGSRIAGGWTGAYVTGSVFAEVGLVGGPLCAIPVGLVGSGLGYFYGSSTATKLYNINDSECYYKALEIQKNKLDRKSIYENIKNTKQEYSKWQPVSFFGKIVKNSMQESLDEMLDEQIIYDANIVADRL